MRTLLFTLSLTILNISLLFGQLTIKGVAIDKVTGETLIGVTIQSDEFKGTTTDINGEFILNINSLNPTLTCSYIGYQNNVITLSGEANEEIDIKVQMIKEASILNTVVVTSNRYGRKIEDEVASIEVIKPTYIENNAITSLSDVMERVPGVQILDDQVNIRSSGYSFGAGSRVGIVVDGQPLLGALAGDIKWNFIPIENAAQIEVVKGAASVLYGAASMNGVINVITAEPTSKPYTSITMYRGIMDDPPSEYRKWWTDDERPGNVGLFLAHRVKVNNNFDVVLGGNIHFNRAHIERGDENRYRFNFKTTYHHSDKLKYGVDGNFMYHKFGTYFIWQDADSNALQHISPIAFNRYNTISVDPHLTYYDDNSNKHTVRGRYFEATLNNNIRDEANVPAYVWGGEYQFQRRFNSDYILTAGVSYQDFFAENPRLGIEIIDTTNTTNVAFDGQSAAVFGQVDKGFLSDKLNLTAGLRLESFNIGNDDFSQVIPTFRLGGTYKSTPTDVFRASYGRGYRIPSLVERYIDAVLIEFPNQLIDNLALRVLPNLEIEPEIGWSSEIGYKKLFNVGDWKGYLDAAVFVMQYDNMAELTFGLHLDDSTATFSEIIQNIGFKYVNATKGRIGGYELTAHLDGKIGTIPLKIWGGYTYTYPGDLDSIETHNQNYWSNLFTAMGTPSAEMIPTIMLYRSLHTARFDIEFYFNKLTLGFVANYNGHIHNIDGIFEGEGQWAELIETLNGQPIIPGFEEYRAANTDGFWVFDARLAYHLNEQHHLHFVVTNVTNKEYALRPGRMNPLRMFNVKYQMEF